MTEKRADSPGRLKHRMRPWALALALLCCANTGAAEWRLTDGALVHPEYRGAVPGKSDVVFSTRWKRAESLDAIKAFGATRVEWVYSTDKAFISSVKEKVSWFGGAINANLKTPGDAGAARDFDGNPIGPPWLRFIGAKQLTTIHPAAVEALREAAERIVESGADSIQVDGPLLQLQTIAWGGDFNPATLEGFNRYLSGYPDKGELAKLGIEELGSANYREFLVSRHGIRNAKDYLGKYRTLSATPIWTRYLRDSVHQHFTQFRAFLNGLSGRRYPLSMNIYELNRPDEKNRSFFLAQHADYVMQEVPVASTRELAIRTATMRSLGVGYVPSILPGSLAENRLAIATLYALGTQPVVPWDVFTGTDKNGRPLDRYFATPENYGDLFAFVRRHPGLFDRAEATAVVGIPVPVDKFRGKETLQLIERLDRSGVPFAFVLAGGVDRKFRIDAGRTRHFRKLVFVNPETDFAPEDLRDLRALSVSRVDSGELTDEAIREWAPLAVAGGLGAIKLYPRTDPARDGSNLVVHVVDESRGGSIGGDPACKRRFSLKQIAAPGKSVAKATWYSLESVVPLDISKGAQEFLVTIPECRLWGMLSFDFIEQVR